MDDYLHNAKRIKIHTSNQAVKKGAVFSIPGRKKLWNQRWRPRNNGKNVNANQFNNTQPLLIGIKIIVWPLPLISQLFHVGF